MSCLYRVCSVMLPEAAAPVYGVEAVTADGAQVLASFPDVFVQHAAAEALARAAMLAGWTPCSCLMCWRMPFAAFDRRGLKGMAARL